jgi:hypothetical protein
MFLTKGSNAEAKDFLAKNGKVIVRMRGLPFNASAKDVVSQPVFIPLILWISLILTEQS